MDDNERKREFGKWNYSVALDSPNKDQAERGSLILHRLVPAPDHGAGFRRDPETGFVYYSSEWLSDVAERNPRCQGCGEKLIPIPVKGHTAIYPSQCRNGHPTGWASQSDPKAPE